MDVNVVTKDGIKQVSTNGVETPKPETPALRRVTAIDLSGPLGEFLSEALPFLEPDTFNASNWRSRLSSILTDNQIFFAVQGRAVILAQASRDFMRPHPVVDIKFLLIADGGEDQDARDLIAACLGWTRGFNGEMWCPLQERTNAPWGRMKDWLKAKEIVRLHVAPLKKK